MASATTDVPFHNVECFGCLNTQQIKTILQEAVADGEAFHGRGPNGAIVVQVAVVDRGLWETTFCNNTGLGRQHRKTNMCKQQLRTPWADSGHGGQTNGKQ